VTAAPGDPQPRRPPVWAWTLSTLTAVGAVGGDVLANRFANIGWITWPAAALAVGWLVLLTWQQVRSQRAAERAAVEPAPAVQASPAGPATSLPYTSGFTGRGGDVRWIVDSLATEHAVAVVGRRGVGTSSCAVQAANEIRAEKPENTVHYLDLRPDGRRLGAREMLGSLARAVDTPPPRSGRADDLAESAGALRRRLDDERILLVLDNVDTPGQVAPLLPPTARCRLLLAGTPALAGLDGVAARGLEEPEPDEAVELFATAGQVVTGASGRRADPRTDPAVREIVDLCGRQPRSIRALGYRMAQHGWRSADLLAILRVAIRAPAHHPLPLADALIPLTDRDTAYTALSPAARRLFRLMSLACGVAQAEPGFGGANHPQCFPVALDLPALRALARLSPGRLRPLLQELVDHAFVEGATGDRYEIRPLLSGYARLHLRYEERTRRRIAAQTRLVRLLARRAERHVASLAVAGLRAPGGDALPAGGAHLPLDGDPYGWFELNGDLLRAVVETTSASPVRPLPRRLRRWWFRLAVALGGWYAHENRLEEWARMCTAVLDAPTASDRSEVAAWAHNELGVLCRRRGDPEGAVAALELALAERGRRDTAQAHLNLGLAQLDLGLVEMATEHLELARRHRARADRAGHALTDLALGAAYLYRTETESGRTARNHAESAHHHLIRAANTFRAIGDSRGYAAALTNLVLAESELGEHLEAAQSWTAALHEHDGLNDPIGRAGTLLNAGAAMTTAAPARAAKAYELLTESLRLRDMRGEHSGLGRTLLYLGDAAQLLRRSETARLHWADAAVVCESVGDEAGAAAANERLTGGA